MNEKTKSLIRHALTAFGFLLTMVGLGKYSGLLNILTTNLDGLFAAISTVAGVITMFIGFFRNKERLVTALVLFVLCTVFTFSNAVYSYAVTPPVNAEYYVPGHPSSAAFVRADHRVQILVVRDYQPGRRPVSFKAAHRSQYIAFDRLE